MKKFLAMLLAVCMMMSFMSLQAAATMEEEFHGPDEWYTAEDIESSRAEMEMYYNKGANIVNSHARTFYYIAVPHLYQDGTASWTDDNMPCGDPKHTYRDFGCGIICYTMVLKYYGNNVTPVDVATTYQNNQNDNCCNFNSEKLLKDYPGRKRSLKSPLVESDYNDVITTIVGAIALDQPVVVKLSEKGGKYHFVVCYGYSETSSGEILIAINDPLTNGKKYLNDYYKKDGRYPVSISIVQ